MPPWLRNLRYPLDLIVFPTLFLPLVGWGLKDGEIYWKEAVAWTFAFIGACCCMVMFPGAIMISIIVAAIIVISLIIRLFGGDIIIH